MDGTVVCPGCQAQLTLPTLPAGQTVQCPRCRHVFEPFQQRIAAKVAVPRAPVVDDDSFEAPRDIDRSLPLRGESLGKAASWFIGICCLLCVAQLCSYIEIAHLIVNLLDHAVIVPPFELENRLADLEDRTRTVYNLMNCAVLPAGIIYLMWLYQASNNLSLLKTAGVRNTPGGTVWMHFFPIANLVFPYLALQEVWRASDPERVEGPRSWQQAPASTLLRFCWASGLLAWLSALIGSLYDSERRFVMQRFNGFLLDDLRNQLTGVWFHVLANAAALLAGVLFVLIIRGITQRQRDRHDEVYRG
jgi:Domain of unknown function (DUF4328)